MISGSGLLAMDRGVSSDPYVILKLGGKKKKSKTIKKSLEPVWNDTLEFKMLRTDLTTLEVSVYDFDLVGRDDFLGEVSGGIDLAECLAKPNAALELPSLSLSLQGEVTLRAKWVPLPPQVRGGDDQTLGEDDQSLIDSGQGYQTRADDTWSGTLRVTLVNASNLVAADAGESSDPYVVLTANGVAHRSKVIQANLHPMWMQEFEWSGDKSALSKVSLEVWDKDLVGQDESIGTCTFNLAKAGVLDEGVDEKKLEGKLSTKGVVRINAEWIKASSDNPKLSMAQIEDQSAAFFLEDEAPLPTIPCPFPPSLGLTLPTIPCR